MGRLPQGKTAYTPILRYRVIATDWEAEESVECWTQTKESAEAIAAALTVRDVSVQIDVVSAPSSLT